MNSFHKIKNKIPFLNAIISYIININNKNIPKCYYKGKCKSRAFVEVYPYTNTELDEDTGEIYKTPYIFSGTWSYLCLKHFVKFKLEGDKFLWREAKKLKELEKENE